MGRSNVSHPSTMDCETACLIRLSRSSESVCHCLGCTRMHGHVFQFPSDGQELSHGRHRSHVHICCGGRNGATRTSCSPVSLAGTADDDGSHLKVWQQWYRAYTGSASSRNLADDESAPGTTAAAGKFPGASPSYARGRSSEDAGPAAEERWMTNHTEEDGDQPEAPEAQRCAS